MSKVNGDNPVDGKASQMLALPVSPRPWILTPQLLQLNFFVGVVLLSSTAMGFDGSMMNGLQSLDTWNLYFGSPDATMLGLMNAVLPLGVIVAALPAGWLADTVGRRYTIMLGALILIMAAAIQGSSQNVAAFIVARFFVGIGIDFSSVPAPVLITEIAHPHHRGKATSLYQTCYYLGAIASSWATFGTFNMTNSTWSWRIPSILQGLFPLIQVTAIWFVPESPRWLISKGRIDEARAFMVKYYVAGDANHPWVESEMQELIAYIKSEKESAGLGWSSLWRTKADKKRLAIAMFTPMISQWAGNGIITYYLSLVLDSVGITDSFTKTLINGILQIFNYFSAVLGSIIVDKAGRRPLWIFSCAGMLVTFIVFTACSAAFVETQSHTVGVVVIIFIFLYFFHYDIAVTPLTFAYPAEVLPFHARQKGMSVCSLCNGLLLMFNSFVNPIALESIGWKYYNVYIILLAIFLVVVYLFFAETKGRSLEDISDIFEGPAIVAGRFQRRSAQNLDMYNGDVDEDLKATTSIVEDIGK